MSGRMIVITDLDVWVFIERKAIPGAGNQDMYNTLMGYAREGWDVHVLTTQVGLAHMPKLHDRIIIHRKPILWVDIQQAAKRCLRRVKFRLWPWRSFSNGTGEGPLGASARYSKVFSRVMARRAAGLAKQLGGVDLIYGYEIFGALGGRLAADRLNVPLVTRFQGTELCRYLDDPATMMKYQVNTEALRLQADRVIMANDGTLGDKVLSMLGVPRERVRFWMNGVVKEDVRRPSVDVQGIRKRLGIAPHEVFILHTGRLFHWKRIDRHLKVLQALRREFEPFKAIFIGDGPERENVLALRHQLGLDDRVQFLGAMPHDQVMEYLNACDIYIAMQDLSNLSNAPIEACVIGKCIVTTAVGGTTDLLTDGVNAVVVNEHDDVEAIARGLHKAASDPQERQRLGEGARRRGEELLSWQERMRVEILDVDEMIRSRQAALETA